MWYINKRVDFDVNVEHEEYFSKLYSSLLLFEPTRIEQTGIKNFDDLLVSAMHQRISKKINKYCGRFELRICPNRIF